MDAGNAGSADVSTARTSPPRAVQELRGALRLGVELQKLLDRGPQLRLSGTLLVQESAALLGRQIEGLLKEGLDDLRGGLGHFNHKEHEEHKELANHPLKAVLQDESFEIDEEAKS